MKTCTSSLIFLTAGLHFIPHHPGLFRPSTDFIVKVRCHPPDPKRRLGGKAENTWHCNTKQDMQLCSSFGLPESMGQRYQTSFNLKQVRDAPSLWWIHRQTQTQLLQWRFVLLLPWRCMCGACQFILSPQSQQCRSWPGQKSFCSVDSQTSGAAHSFLGGFTGGILSVALLWLFTLLMMGKGGRENYSFIYPSFLNTELCKQVD